MAEGKRGFASMDPERQRKIASQGGKAAHAKGSAHEFTADEARDAGRKGGLAVSQNREHMSMIGREGGKSRGRNVARRLAEQRAAGQTEAPRSEGQGDEVASGQRVESEGRSEGAFMGGPAQSERSGGEGVSSREDITEGEERGRGGLGGPDRGE